MELNLNNILEEIYSLAEENEDGNLVVNYQDIERILNKYFKDYGINNNFLQSK